MTLVTFSAAFCFLGKKTVAFMSSIKSACETINLLFCSSKNVLILINNGFIPSFD